MDSRGVSLIELVIVLGLLTTLLTVGSVASLSSFAAIGIKNDQNLLMDVLLLARAQAQQGKCAASDCFTGAPYGVHISDTSLTLFEGISFENRNKEADVAYPRSSTAETTGTKEYVFKPIYGSPFAAGTTSIEVQAIYVDKYGRIGKAHLPL